LNALFVPAYVPENPFDLVSEIDQKLARIGRLIVVQKCPGPLLDKAIRIVRLTLYETDQIRHLFGAVHERTETGIFLDIQLLNVCGEVLQLNGALKLQLSGAPGKAGHGHLVAKNILPLANTPWFRANHELRGDLSLIVAIEWTQPHPVIAEGNRAPVFVGRDMPDEQRGHRDPLINVECYVTYDTTFAAATETFCLTQSELVPRIPRPHQ